MSRLPLWTFVRHAESVANATRVFAGHLDSPLSQSGTAQARALAAHLTAIPREQIVRSDLIRTASTARLALGDEADRARVLPALRERHLGVFQGKHKDQVDRSPLVSWDLAPAGGETLRDLALRALVSLHGLPAVDTLVFTHGGVMRALVGLLEGVDQARIPTLRFGNCAVHSCQVKPGRFRDLADHLRTQRRDRAGS